MEVMDRAPKEWRKRFKVNEFANAFAEKKSDISNIRIFFITTPYHCALCVINKLAILNKL